MDNSMDGVVRVYSKYTSVLGLKWDAGAFGHRLGSYHDGFCDEYVCGYCANRDFTPLVSLFVFQIRGEIEGERAKLSRCR